MANFKKFGGNSGYVGYSKSKRAVDAERRGLRNKTQMDKEFADEVNEIIKAEVPTAKRVTLSEIKASLFRIKADEWHHTSKFGNETNYYSAETIANYFTPKEEKVQSEKDKLKDEKLKILHNIENEVYKSFDTIKYYYNTLDNLEDKYFTASNGIKVLIFKDIFDTKLKVKDTDKFLENGKAYDFGDIWSYPNLKTKTSEAETAILEMKAEVINRRDIFMNIYKDEIDYLDKKIKELNSKEKLQGLAPIEKQIEWIKNHQNVEFDDSTISEIKDLFGVSILKKGDDFGLEEFNEEIYKQVKETVRDDFWKLIFNKISYIEKDALFSKTQITSLGNLQTIGGKANFFSYSGITNLGNLQTIGSDARFGFSEISDLGNLQTIGGKADFGNRLDLKKEWKEREKNNPKVKLQEFPLETYILQDFSLETYIAHLFQNGEKLDWKKAKKIAKELFKIENNTKIMQACELGCMLEARRIAHNGNSLAQQYEELKDLYERQIIIRPLDTKSKVLQQYSTPCPLAYLLGKFIQNRDEKINILEPSAGNGLLTIAFNKEDVEVNELDEIRFENLKKIGFHKVTNIDASNAEALKKEYHLKSFKGIITNPPFKKLNNIDRIERNGWQINALDYKMATLALDFMEDDGCASIIVGGKMWNEYWKPLDEHSEKQVLFGQWKQFLGYLYAQYNVLDVLYVNGENIYQKQGTQYPFVIILIEGRRIYDETNRPRYIFDEEKDKIINTFDQLFDRLIQYIKKIDFNDTEVKRKKALALSLKMKMAKASQIII